ncbi:MAG: DUF4364 family protein [Clostridia bacterium]|nr:DUF4364 family protein [Clostridia bacterium]
MEPRPQSNPAHDRLLLLYLLDGADMWLSELQIVQVFSELGLLTYFAIKAGLAELVQSGLAEENVADSSSSYHILPEGSSTIATLLNDVRLSMREALDAYLEAHRSVLSAESRFRSYFLTENGRIRVHLEIHAGGRPIFELIVEAGSRAEAQQMTHLWRDHAVSIYQSVLANLC